MKKILIVTMFLLSSINLFAVDMFIGHNGNEQRIVVIKEITAVRVYDQKRFIVYFNGDSLTFKYKTSEEAKKWYGNLLKKIANQKETKCKE